MSDALPPELRPAAPPPTPEEEAMVPEALACIDRVLRLELRLERPVRLDDRLVHDLQLDSVTLITLVVELENTFRVALREEDAAEVHTVRELALLVARRKVEASAGLPAPGSPR